MLVTGIVCPKCRERIYSRARYDFRRCSCGDVIVDGGLLGSRVAWKTGEGELFTEEIDVTLQELYLDWSYTRNRYGKLPPLLEAPTA